GDQRAESRVLEYLGLLALDSRDDARAVELLEQARVCGQPPTARERPSLYRALGRAHAGTGDLIQAAAVLQTAFDEVSDAPVDPALMVQFGSYLANAYTDRGRFADAEQVLRRVLTRMERGEELRAQGRAHLLIAGVLLDQEQSGEAAEHLDRAATLMTEEAPVELALLSYERARAALASGDLTSAKDHAEISVKRTEATEPGSAGMAYAVLAEVALAEGRLDDARFLCQEGIRLMTDRAAPTYIARAYETLSRVEERAGNLEAALEALRTRPDVGVAKT